MTQSIHVDTLPHTSPSRELHTSEQERAKIENELRAKYRIPARTEQRPLDFGYRSEAARNAVQEHSADLGNILHHEFITKSALPRDETEAATITTQEELSSVIASFMKDEPWFSYAGWKERAFYYGYEAVDRVMKTHHAEEYLAKIRCTPALAIRAIEERMLKFKDYSTHLESESTQLSTQLKDILKEKDDQTCRLTQSYLRGGILKHVYEKLESNRAMLEADYERAVLTADPQLVQGVTREKSKHDEDYSQLELDLNDTANDLRNAQFTLSVLGNLEAQIREDVLTTRKNVQNLGGLANKYAAMLTIVQRLEGYSPGHELSELKMLVEKSEKQAVHLGKLSTAKLRGAFSLPDPLPLEIQQSYTDPRARSQRIERLMGEVEELGMHFLRRER